MRQVLFFAFLGFLMGFSFILFIAGVISFAMWDLQPFYDPEMWQAARIFALVGSLLMGFIASVKL